MIIRPERADDRDAIEAVTRAAFGKEQEVRMIEAIRASNGFVPDLSLVVEVDGRVAGHVLLSYVELGEGRVLELGPIGVLPEVQRQGIGSALVREALERADALGEPLVLVLGHPWYYPRFGFVRASTLGIEPPGERIPDEAWMAIPLSGYGPGLRGRVVFPPAFSA